MTKQDAQNALDLIDEALAILQRRYSFTGNDIDRFRTDLARARELIDRAKAFF